MTSKDLIVQIMVLYLDNDIPSSLSSIPCFIYKERRCLMIANSSGASFSIKPKKIA